MKRQGICWREWWIWGCRVDGSGRLNRNCSHGFSIMLGYFCFHTLVAYRKFFFLKLEIAKVWLRDEKTWNMLEELMHTEVQSRRNRGRPKRRWRDSKGRPERARTDRTQVLGLSCMERASQKRQDCIDMGNEMQQNSRNLKKEQRWKKKRNKENLCISVYKAFLYNYASRLMEFIHLPF